MLQLYKNRSLEVGKKVRVYFNLHTNLFSVVSMEGKHKGKVVAHGNGIIIAEAEFKVNKAGQEKVRKAKRKSVHAYVDGLFSGLTDETLNKQAYYNPYLTDYFIDWQSKKNVFKAKAVVLIDKRVTYL